VTKYTNELYASTFSRCYLIDTIGLRYFNVFGPRQNPNGTYAAVIPRWINALLNNDKVHIYGDGGTSRDFCYIEDIIQANILGALTQNKTAINTVYNISSGNEISLNQLYKLLCKKLNVPNNSLFYDNFRPGDIRRSLSSIKKAKNELGYCPSYSMEEGLSQTIDWHYQLKNKKNIN
jgi:UDP-N-acetylglucosamine 4-epimerase